MWMQKMDIKGSRSEKNGDGRKKETPYFTALGMCP
jgi:hypothetical protein